MTNSRMPEKTSTSESIDLQKSPVNLDKFYDLWYEACLEKKYDEASLYAKEIIPDDFFPKNNPDGKIAIRCDLLENTYLNEEYDDAHLQVKNLITEFGDNSPQALAWRFFKGKIYTKQENFDLAEKEFNDILDSKKEPGKHAKIYESDLPSLFKKYGPTTLYKKIIMHSRIALMEMHIEKCDKTTKSNKLEFTKNLIKAREASNKVTERMQLKKFQKPEIHDNVMEQFNETSLIFNKKWEVYKKAKKDFESALERENVKLTEEYLIDSYLTTQDISDQLHKKTLSDSNFFLLYFYLHKHDPQQLPKYEIQYIQHYFKQTHHDSSVEAEFKSISNKILSQKDKTRWNEILLPIYENAIISSETENVKKLKDLTGLSPLHVAITTKNITLAKQLVEKLEASEEKTSQDFTQQEKIYLILYRQTQSLGRNKTHDILLTVTNFISSKIEDVLLTQNQITFKRKSDQTVVNLQNAQIDKVLSQGKAHETPNPVKLTDALLQAATPTRIAQKTQTSQTTVHATSASSTPVVTEETKETKKTQSVINPKLLRLKIDSENFSIRIEGLLSELKGANDINKKKGDSQKLKDQAEQAFKSNNEKNLEKATIALESLRNELIKLDNNAKKLLKANTQVTTIVTSERKTATPPPSVSKNPTTSPSGFFFKTSRLATPITEHKFTASVKQKTNRFKSKSRKTNILTPYHEIMKIISGLQSQDEQKSLSPNQKITNHFASLYNMMRLIILLLKRERILSKYGSPLAADRKLKNLLEDARNALVHHGLLFNYSSYENLLTYLKNISTDKDRSHLSLMRSAFFSAGNSGVADYLERHKIFSFLSDKTFVDQLQQFIPASTIKSIVSTEDSHVVRKAESIIAMINIIWTPLDEILNNKNREISLANFSTQYAKEFDALRMLIQMCGELPIDQTQEQAKTAIATAPKLKVDATEYYSSLYSFVRASRSFRNIESHKILGIALEDLSTHCCHAKSIKASPDLASYPWLQSIFNIQSVTEKSVSTVMTKTI